MVVSTTIRSVLLYSSLAIALVALVAFAWRRADTRGLKRWVPLVPGVLALIATYWIYTHDIEVVLVTDIESGPLAVRKVNLGANDFARAPGTKELDNPIGMTTSWVVNRSSHTVRLESVQYGWGESSSTDLPPGTAIEIFGDVDYLGPKHRPPRQVVGDARLGGASRYWLTW